MQLVFLGAVSLHPKKPVQLYYVTQYRFKVPVEEILSWHKVFLM